jgi:PAS domain S-box-containing protein
VVSENASSFIPLAPLAISFETMAALASRMSDGICLLNGAGLIRYANPALRALLGRSEAELLDKRIDEFRDDAPNASDATVEPWSISQRVSIARWRRADGGVFEARCALEPLVEGAEHGASLLLMTPTAALARGDNVSDDASVVEDTRTETPDREAVQTERAARRWVEVIEAVADVTLARLPVSDLIEAMLNRIRPALGLENAAVLLFNEAGDALEAPVAAGAGREFASEVRLPADDPLISDALASREPVVINNAGAVLRDSGFFPEPLFSAMSVHSMVLTPLIVEDQVIGLFYLGAGAPDHFTVDDIRLARVAGARVALAVDGARSRAAAAAARRRLMVLAEAGATLVGPLDPQVIATRLVERIAPSYADACALYLVQDDGMAHKVAVSAPTLDDGLAGPAYAAVMLALERLPEEAPGLEIAPDTGADQSGRGKSGVARLESAVITPITVESHGHPVGVMLLIEGTGRTLASEDLTLVSGLAMRAAIGMEIARLYAELEQALKRVSETAVQLDTVFDSTDAAIFLTDAAGRYLRINAYGARMLGMEETTRTDGVPTRKRERVTFELRDEQGRPVPRDEDPLHAARMRNAAVERRVIIHRFDSGQDIPALARCAPLRDGRGRVTGVVGVVMDITGIHEIERQKDEFLGIVSHELKTPLTTLKILAQMLTRRMRASGVLRELEQAERMSTAITRMERLIGDLLDVSRIHEGKLALTITVCDLGAICRDAAREQEIISQRPITLSLPDRESLPIHADVERLRQVVINLLSNALKYSPTNAPVILRARESGANYLVSVEDQGPGLTLAEQRRLFERFYRAPSVRVQSGSGVGLGLGLFISREIVNAHDGEIWVEGEPGSGSVFTFSIPRAGHGDAEDIENGE